jgi:hypothetical protein
MASLKALKKGNDAAYHSAARRVIADLQKHGQVRTVNEAFVACGYSVQCELYEKWFINEKGVVCVLHHELDVHMVRALMPYEAQLGIHNMFTLDRYLRKLPRKGLLLQREAKTGHVWPYPGAEQEIKTASGRGLVIIESGSKRSRITLHIVDQPCRRMPSALVSLWENLTEQKVRSTAVAIPKKEKAPRKRARCDIDELMRQQRIDAEPHLFIAPTPEASTRPPQLITPEFKSRVQKTSWEIL